MANIARTYTFVNGQPADATQVNKNFDDIINGVGDVTTLRPTVGSLGLDADIATLALPANTTISALAKDFLGNTTNAEQLVSLGVAAWNDARLYDARVASDVSAWAKAGAKPTYTYDEVGAPSTSDSRLSDARPASDVSAWAKAASKPSYTAAEVGTKKITTGSYYGIGGDVDIAHGLGTTPTFVLYIVSNTVVLTNTYTSTTFRVSPGTNVTGLWFAVA